MFFKNKRQWQLIGIPSLADFEWAKAIFSLEGETSCTACLAKAWEQFKSLMASYRSVACFTDWLVKFRKGSNQVNGKPMNFGTDNDYEWELLLKFNSVYFKNNMSSDFEFTHCNHNLIPSQLDELTCYRHYMIASAFINNPPGLVNDVFNLHLLNPLQQHCDTDLNIRIPPSHLSNHPHHFKSQLYLTYIMEANDFFISPSEHEDDHAFKELLCKFSHGLCWEHNIWVVSDSDSPFSSDSFSDNELCCHCNHGRHWLCCNNHHRCNASPFSDHCCGNNHHTKLKPEDIMMFDSEETGVCNFILWFQQIACIYGDCSVLMVLSWCLCGEALEWLIELKSDIIEIMNDDLYCWEMELLKQFGRFWQQVMQEALYLCYCFSDRHNLLISSYFTCKVSLLCEAGITDQIQLVQHLYDGLEAQLQVSCLIDEFADDFSSLNEFWCKVKNQEAAVFKLWTLNWQASCFSFKQFEEKETRFSNKSEVSSFNHFCNSEWPQASDCEKNFKLTAQTSDYKNNFNNFNNQHHSFNFRNLTQDSWKKPFWNNQAFHAVQDNESAQEDTNLSSASDISDDDHSDNEAPQASKNDWLILDIIFLL